MRAHRAPACAPRRQRGAALLTAMIIVTLVTTLAAAMVWQQWRAVQVESAERARAQAAWILNGALDWARLILREDMRGNGPTALTEPWATPLAEARLSTFLAVDKSNADDGPEAFLSGYITDAQARYNLRNLVDQNNKVDLPEIATLEYLCQSVGVETGIATRIANGLSNALVPTTAAAPLMPLTIAQLSWLGIDAASLQALQPYVVLLTRRTPVNVNTASREVLTAVTNSADAERLLQVRQRTPFKDAAAIEREIPTLAPLNQNRLSAQSSFFEVRGRLRLEDRVLVERSLVERSRGPPLQVNPVHRERISSLDPAGAQ